MKRPLNITISEEARRLLTLHAERSGTSVSGLIERLIRQEDRQIKEVIARLGMITVEIYTHGSVLDSSITLEKSDIKVHSIDLGESINAGDYEKIWQSIIEDMDTSTLQPEKWYYLNMIRRKEKESGYWFEILNITLTG